MLRTLIFLIVCFLAVLTSAAQEADTFEIGRATVRVPAPQGLVNGYPSIPQIEARVRTVEQGDRRTLAMYIPTEAAEKLIAGAEVPPLALYAVLAVHRRMDEKEVTPKEFERFSQKLEKEFDKFLDEKMPKVIESGKRSMEKAEGKPVELAMSKPVTLGVFDRRSNVVSMIMSNTVEYEGRATLKLSVMMHVLVKGRLLYISVIKDRQSDKDVDTLREFSKRWADSILAANN